MYKKLMNEIKKESNPDTYRIYANHGLTNQFGTKLSIVKEIAKREKNLPTEELKNLYMTGILECQHLAQYIINRTKRHNELTTKDFNNFMKMSDDHMSREYILAELIGVKGDIDYIKMLLKDIKDPVKASVGLPAFSIYLRNHRDFNDKIIDELLKTAKSSIHELPNRVKYQLNGTIISIGTYLKHRHKEAIEVSKSYGKVEVFMGETSCSVPSAPDYIVKASKRINEQKKAVYWYGCK